MPFSKPDSLSWGIPHIILSNLIINCKGISQKERLAFFGRKMAVRFIKARKFYLAGHIVNRELMLLYSCVHFYGEPCTVQYDPFFRILKMSVAFAKFMGNEVARVNDYEESSINEMCSLN